MSENMLSMLGTWKMNRGTTGSQTNWTAAKLDCMMNGPQYEWTDRLLEYMIDGPQLDLTGFYHRWRAETCLKILPFKAWKNWGFLMKIIILSTLRITYNIFWKFSLSPSFILPLGSCVASFSSPSIVKLWSSWIHFACVGVAPPRLLTPQANGINNIHLCCRSYHICSSWHQWGCVCNYADREKTPLN